jgi:histidinol dehydrogenase
MAALGELVSIQYFREHHKAVAQAWNVLNALAPELAELSANDPRAAWQRIHGSDD